MTSLLIPLLFAVLIRYAIAADGVDRNSCLNMRCEEGMVCVKGREGSQCMAMDPSNNCNTLRCYGAGCKYKATECIPDKACFAEPICKSGVRPRGSPANFQSGQASPTVSSTSTQPPCLAKCSENQRCVLRYDDNSCYNPPCRPVPTCVNLTTQPADIEGNGGEIRLAACNLFCIQGRRCQVTPGGPRCVPIPTCAELTCPAGQTCRQDDLDLPASCSPIQPVCGENEEVNSCGALCERKCENVGKGPIVCPLICLPPACVCKEGFYRNPTNRRCVPALQCPPICGPNEEVRQCGSFCQPRCPPIGRLPVCPTVCGPPDCICKTPLLRLGERCVPPNNCPVIPLVVPTTNTRDPIISSGNEPVTGTTTSSPVSSSPSPRVCRPDEELRQCGSFCQPRCSIGRLPVCPTVCGPPDCICKAPLVRLGERCVPQSDCPRIPPITNTRDPMTSYGDEPITGTATSSPANSSPSPRGTVTQMTPLAGSSSPSPTVTATTTPSADSSPSPRVCGPDEVSRACGSFCQPRCPSRFRLPVCPPTCGPPDCICRPPLVRLGERCVPPNMCPKFPPPTNTRDQMTSYGDEPNIGVQASILTAGPSSPQPGACSTNEVYNQCGNRCDPTCAEINGEPRLCPAICDPPACACAPRFYRLNGQCVTRQQCLAGNSGKVSRSRSRRQTDPMTGYGDEPALPEPLGPPLDPCFSFPCRIGETCMQDENGPRCVPPALQCSINETVSNCGALCEGKCATVDEQNRPCPDICLPAACACSLGYFRNQDGKCVSAGDCPSRCPENEQINTCGRSCEPTCENAFGKIKVCNLICNPPACVCKPNFYRHNGACIPQMQCTPPRDGLGSITLNEIDTSTSTTSASSTSYVDEPITPRSGNGRNYVDEPITPRQGGDQNGGSNVGTSLQCGTNEEVGQCGNLCEPGCENAFGEPKVCILICNPPACVCKANFYRKDGRCVPRSECPAPTNANGNNKYGDEPVTPASGSTAVLSTTQSSPISNPQLSCTVNETVSQCGNLCEGKCENLGKGPIACPAICEPPACACKNGYYRNRGDRCIAEMDCAALDCKTNEVVNSCGSACEPTCENAFGRPKVCDRVCRPAACVCRPNYYRNNGVCVPQSGCAMPTTSAISTSSYVDEPVTPRSGNRRTYVDEPITPRQGGGQNGRTNVGTGLQCGANEEVGQCGNLCEPGCENAFGEPKVCIEICNPPACICKTNFYRKDDRCVPKSECPAPANVRANGSNKYGDETVTPAAASGSAAVVRAVQSGPNGAPRMACSVNETFRQCGNLCEGKCENLGKGPIGCAAICGPAACACKEGYYRNSEGKCVVGMDCSLNCKTNEVVNPCGSACEPTCENAFGRPKICDRVCRPAACVCRPNYYRNNGVCVPQSGCGVSGAAASTNPIQITAGSTGNTGRTRSSSASAPVSTASQRSGSGKPLVCGRNEVVGSCGNLCEPTCENAFGKPKICSRVCNPPACICRPNYYRNKGTCIPQASCVDQVSICDAMSCEEGTVCAEAENEQSARCQAKDPENNCETTECPPDAVCEYRETECIPDKACFAEPVCVVYERIVAA